MKEVPTTPERKPHAVLDLESRRYKAMKVERLLGLEPVTHPVAMLEIGTGSGGIANYFGTHEVLQIDVCSVDVVDNRQVHEGYQFELVSDTNVPYADGTFDIVVANHVIEHVGGRDAQLRHLKEISRVLKREGCAYLAVPNRWQLVEPHYRLAFLSWLPLSWRTPYLRLMRKGDFYDCEPLSANSLETLLGEAGFNFESVGINALHLTLELEPKSFRYIRWLRFSPRFLLMMFQKMLPTHIYLLRTR